MKLERVMVIEDDPDISDILDLSLSSIGGFTVTVCNRAKDALQKISTVDPQLVILDVMLPEMSGSEALVEIRALPGGNERTIVMLTAKISPTVASQLIHSGADEVMSKPFDPMKLPGLLLDVWNKKNGRA